MGGNEWVALVTVLALLFFFWTGIRVAGARGKFNVPAPATTGNPDFERIFRVQQNTLEQLVLFLPALWLFASYWGGMIAAGVGAVWLIGRILYAVGYTAAAGQRGFGFLVTMLANVVLVLGALGGIGIAIAKMYGVGA